MAKHNGALQHEVSVLCFYCFLSLAFLSSSNARRGPQACASALPRHGAVIMTGATATMPEHIHNSTKHTEHVLR